VGGNYGVDLLWVLINRNISSNGDAIMWILTGVISALLGGIIGWVFYAVVRHPPKEEPPPSQMESEPKVELHRTVDVNLDDFSGSFPEILDQDGLAEMEAVDFNEQPDEQNSQEEDPST